MQVNCGKVHKCLGMTCDYTTVGQVKTTMLNYAYGILDIFDKLDSTGGGTKSSSVSAIIFKVGEDCIKLNTKQSVEFHHLLVKILFATKRYRPDMCTVI